MEEQLISFETAKLAKEKGFNTPCVDTYKGGKLYKHKDKRYNSAFKRQFVVAPIKNSNMLNAKIYRCSAPTQSLLQKWLREKHNLHINIMADKIYYKGNIDIVFDIDIIDSKGERLISISPIETYEEALERGLQNALKLIKSSGENKG